MIEHLEESFYLIRNCQVPDPLKVGFGMVLISVVAFFYCLVGSFHRESPIAIPIPIQLIIESVVLRYEYIVNGIGEVLWQLDRYGL